MDLNNLQHWLVWAALQFIPAVSEQPQSNISEYCHWRDNEWIPWYNKKHNKNYKDFDELAADLYEDVLEYLRSDNPNLVPNSLIDFLTNK